jgi:hypothetical protein
MWTPLVQAQKEINLMRAVKMMEAYIEWCGRKYDPYQPIGWPRDWVYGPDNDIYVLPHDKVPLQVQESQALMALNLAEGFSQDDASQPPLNFLKISSLSLSFNNEQSARSSSLLPSEVTKSSVALANTSEPRAKARSVQIVR